MNKARILKTFFLLLLILLSHFRSKAQSLLEDTVKRDSSVAESHRPRTVFLELGGPGLAITANYDTRFGSGRDKWGYRIGTGYYNTGANSVFTIPFQLNYLYGKTSSFLELGVGTTFLHSRGSTNGTVFQFDNVTGFIGTGTIGYRYQQEEGGINFRINFVPILYDQGLTYGGGLSIGYTF
jgi:hypothetical protein